MRTSIITLTTILVFVLAAMLYSGGVSAQTTPVPPGAAPGQAAPGDEQDTPAATYNPYPPGILPSDLDSELARVIREVEPARSLSRSAMPPSFATQSRRKRK